MTKFKEFFLNQSLKKKWTLSSAIVIFTSYTVLCIVLYFALYTWLIHNEQNNATRTADDLSSFFKTQNGSMSIQELQNNTGLMKAIINQNQTVRIFNLDGYEVLRINNTHPAVAIRVSVDDLKNTVISKVKLKEQQVFVVERIVQIGPFQGYMQLIHPLANFQSMMKYVLTAMIITGFGALLSAGGLSFYLANILMKPLQDLRDSMITVREKGFVEEIRLTYPADDEIGDLLNIYRLMIQELQSSFAKQQQFVSDASHELRTPIQAIEGHLSLIKRWGKDNPEVLEESLSITIIEVQRMKKMMEELLDLAREEERDDQAVANIGNIIHSVKDEIEIVYPEATVNLLEVGERARPHITENALFQIVRNIVENGIRYNDKKPVIEIQVNYLNDNIFMTIKDNGIGISNEHIPHIFDRFYRVDASRQNVDGGTGLGLSITKMLADKYHVEMDVSSFLGKGTIFTLRFPKKL